MAAGESLLVGRVRWSLGIVAVLTVALLGVPGIARSDPRATEHRLHERSLYSRALGGRTNVRVLLPRDYDDGTRRYPVLFLLHGAGGSETAWTMKTNVVPELTADLDVIVVMPDGGPDGWYSDWVDGPAWESYHIGELVPFIDRHYRTLGTRAGRAVVGNSMGGYGAMIYAARHPDLFVAAASFSGAVDNSAGSVAQAAANQLLHERLNTPTEEVWGSYTDNEVNWRGHNPPDLATNLRDVKIDLFTGNGVMQPGDRPETAPTEVGVYTLNSLFHARLNDASIAHGWNDRGHGTHDWPYWERDLKQWLLNVMDTFAHPPPSRTAFDYRSTEPTFDVWGWSFTAERDVQEFLDLRAVSPAALTATGSGVVEVVTPPIYRPGSHYRVGNEIVRAATDRRLRFTIDLSPSHTQQHYTAGQRVEEATALGEYFRTVTVRIEPLN